MKWQMCKGFPGGISDKEPTCQCKRCKICGFDPWVGKIPRRKKWHPLPVFLSGEVQRQSNLPGYRPQGGKQSDTTE